MSHTPFCIEASGLACPQPVILCKNHWEAKQEPFAIRVGNEPAVENVQKWGRSVSLVPSVQTLGENLWEVSFALPADAKATETLSSPKVAPTQASAVSPTFPTPVHPGLAAGLQSGQFSLFVGKDHIGEGDPELGGNLATMFFYTLTEASRIPGVIAFMNTGVYLATRNEQIVAHLQTLQERGVRILVCGTCTKFYGIEELPVGEISNFYEIWEALTTAGPVVSL